jgi:hypothetical protein
VVYDDLVEAREKAAKLQAMVQGLPSGEKLMKEMVGKLSSAMSVLHTAAGVAASSSSAVGQGPGRRRKRSGAAAVSSGPHRRTSSRRR